MRISILASVLSACCLTGSASAQLLDDSGFVPKSSDTRLRYWAIDGALRGALGSAYGSLGTSRTVAMKFPLTLAIGARWDVGAAKRPSDWLLSQRLVAGSDLRWHRRSRESFGFLRLGLGALLDARGAAFTGEASVGGSVIVAQMDDDPTEHLPHLWLSPEAGFAWTPAVSALSGPFARLMVTMSF